jgi:hypothetical protein
MTIATLKHVSDFIAEVFKAKQAGEWQRLGDTSWTVDLMRDGKIEQKVVYDDATDELHLYKYAGAIGFQKTVDGLAPFRLKDRMPQGLEAANLTASYRPDSKLVRIAMETLGQSVGTQIPVEEFGRIIEHLKIVHQKAVEASANDA